MRQSKPFLGETTDRARAFPGISVLEVKVEQDKWEHYTEKPSQRESRFTLANVPKHVPCVNPRCQQGGLDLQEIVVFFSNGEHVLSCNGHEGSPSGRREGEACDNSFVVTINKTEEGK